MELKLNVSMKKIMGTGGALYKLKNIIKENFFNKW